MFDSPSPEQDDGRTWHLVRPVWTVYGGTATTTTAPQQQLNTFGCFTFHRYFWVHIKCDSKHLSLLLYSTHLQRSIFGNVEGGVERSQRIKVSKLKRAAKISVDKFQILDLKHKSQNRSKLTEFVKYVLVSSYEPEHRTTQPQHRAKPRDPIMFSSPTLGTGRPPAALPCFY